MKAWIWFDIEINSFEQASFLEYSWNTEFWLHRVLNISGILGIRDFFSHFQIFPRNVKFQAFSEIIFLFLLLLWLFSLLILSLLISLLWFHCFMVNVTLQRERNPKFTGHNPIYFIPEELFYSILLIMFKKIAKSAKNFFSNKFDIWTKKGSKTAEPENYF